MDFFWKIFGNFLAYFWAPWAPQGPQNGPRDPGDRFKIEKNKKLMKMFIKIRFFPPQGPENGPRAPGDRFKIKKKIRFFQIFGPEVSTIFEILIFGFWGVFLMGI